MLCKACNVAGESLGRWILHLNESESPASSHTFKLHSSLRSLRAAAKLGCQLCYFISAAIPQEQQRWQRQKHPVLLVIEDYELNEKLLGGGLLVASYLEVEVVFEMRQMDVPGDNDSRDIINGTIAKHCQRIPSNFLANLHPHCQI
jgi:hypothetical protein